MYTRLIVTATLLTLTGWGCSASNPSIQSNTGLLEAAGPTAISIKNQLIPNGVLAIEHVQFAQDVWVIVQADDNGQPGRVVGRATYAGRTLSNLELLLEANVTSPVLHVSVHADNGAKGSYEPTTEDKLLTYQGVPVATTIQATYLGSSNAPYVDQNSYSTSTNNEPVSVELNLNANTNF